jgi:hypothetical protein
MLYKCEICAYETNRLLNFQRHEQRKIPCKPKKTNSRREDEVNVNGQNKAVNGQSKAVNGQSKAVNAPNKAIHGQNEAIHGQNEAVNGQNIKKFQCLKCMKEFPRIKRLQNHEKKCDGLDKRQCGMCLKMFASPHGRYKHTLYVKCTAPATTINNINNTNNTNNTNNINNIDNSTTNNIDNSITNNNQQYITNNIRVCFGKEDVKSLQHEADYMKRVDNYVRMVNYGLPLVLQDICFNDKYPENHTIKKTRKNDNLVDIHVGDNKWEKRYIQDISPTTIEKIHDYMEFYVENTTLNERKKMLLKQFGKEMAKLQYWSTESIEDRLEIEEYEMPTEDTMNRQARLINKLLSEKILEQTKKQMGK